MKVVRLMLKGLVLDSTEDTVLYQDENGIRLVI